MAIPEKFEVNKPIFMNESSEEKIKMKKLPEFNSKEIEYLHNLVFASDTELIDADFSIPCKSFTPFKNDLANKLTKYRNVLRYKEYRKE